jgi:hypothetical protein
LDSLQRRRSVDLLLDKQQLQRRVLLPLVKPQIRTQRLLPLASHQIRVKPLQDLGRLLVWDQSLRHLARVQQRVLAELSESLLSAHLGLVKHLCLALEVLWVRLAAWGKNLPLDQPRRQVQHLPLVSIVL